MGFADKRFCVAVSDKEKPETDASKYCDQVLAVCLNDDGNSTNNVTVMVGGDLTELLIALLNGKIGKAMEDAASELRMKHLPWLCRFLRREKKKDEKKQ